MGKDLREMIRAPEIGSAVMISKMLYVKDRQGNILFLLPCDDLLGYTPTSITVRVAAHALTYNNMGSQTNIETIRNH